MSQVVVFNTNPEQLNLILNQGMPQPVAAAAPPSGALPSVAFPRGPGGFGGQNQLLVANPVGSNQLYSIDTSAFQLQPQADLQLYLFTSHAVLTSGWADQVVSAQSFGGESLAAEAKGPPAATPQD